MGWRYGRTLNFRSYSGSPKFMIISRSVYSIWWAVSRTGDQPLKVHRLVDVGSPLPFSLEIKERISIPKYNPGPKVARHDADYSRHSMVVKHTGLSLPQNLKARNVGLL